MLSAGVRARSLRAIVTRATSLRSALSGPDFAHRPTLPDVGAPGSGAGSSPRDMVEQICTVDAVIVDARTRITVPGELDALAAPDLQAAFASAAPGHVGLHPRDLTLLDTIRTASCWGEHSPSA